jgi:hypothetical protein
MLEWIVHHPASIALVATIAVVVAGVISIWRACRDFERRCAFAAEYLQKLQSYIRSRGEDDQAYTWMTQRSERMQMQLGSGGILDYYQRPFAQFAARNVPVILNILPELRLWLSDGVLNRGSHQLESMLQEILIRHVGLLNDGIQDRRKQLLNPIAWIREGVASVLLAPIRLLADLGILGTPTPSRVAASAAFRVASGISSLIGFIAAIATIVGEWDGLARLATRMLSK